MAFYENFLQQCLKKGVSAYQACMDLKLSHSALGKWKNGSNPRNSTLMDMASYFGCDIMELVNGEYKPTDEDYVPPMPRSAVDSYQTFLRAASILEENEIKRVTQYIYQVLGERKD